MAEKRPQLPKRQPLTSAPAPADTTATDPTKSKKRVVYGSWGALKLRFSNRHNDFDESRDS